MKAFGILLVVALFCSVSHGGVEYYHKDSKDKVCPDGSPPMVTGFSMDLDVYCYGNNNDSYFVSVENRPMSNDPTDGVLFFTESPSQCGLIRKYIDLRDIAGEIDLHRPVYVRVLTIASPYPAIVKQMNILHECL